MGNRQSRPNTATGTVNEDEERLFTISAVERDKNREPECLLKREDLFAKPFDLVAAIDFGTTSSGTAYSSVTDFQRDPLNISCTTKDTIPTCILLDNKEQFVSFGHDAQRMYAEKRQRKEEASFAYYHFFKMLLYDNKQPLLELEAEDVSKVTKVSAKKLIGFAIKAMSESLMEDIKGTGKYAEISKKRIRWVLTVPAIWDDDAKLFMRECAIGAGIPEEQLIIALEPEAASIFCNYVTTERKNEISPEYEVPTTGKKYVVVDIGGGTTDITVHEKLKNNRLKELAKSSGKGIGGHAVNLELMGLVQNKLSGTIVSKLQEEKPVVYLDLHNDIEDIKRDIDDDTNDTVDIPVNRRAMNDISRQLFNTTITKRISGQIVDESLQVKAKSIKDKFKPTIDSILEAVQDALQFDTLNEVSMIVLVGGFANCQLLQTAIKKRFSNKTIVVPNDASLAVLQGAVLFGHNPKIIDSRVTKFTYGIGINLPFDKSVHDASKKIRRGQKEYCCKVFDVIIKQNENVPLGMTRSRRYTITPKRNIHISYLYASSSECPIYIDDPTCKKVGKINLTFPKQAKDIADVQFLIEIDFFFGGTEIMVKATDRQTGQSVDTAISLECDDKSASM